VVVGLIGQERVLPRYAFRFLFLFLLAYLGTKCERWCRGGKTGEVGEMIRRCGLVRSVLVCC
jgi:hypothetical protein